MSEVNHERESNSVILINNQGDEEVVTALQAGPGEDRVNPAPGTPGWVEIVQAGVDSALAVKPHPNEEELAIWTRVAREQLPLEYVTRVTQNESAAGSLRLRVPKERKPKVNVAEMMEEVSESMEQREIIEMDQKVDRDPITGMYEDKRPYQAPGKAQMQGFIQAIYILCENDMPPATYLPLLAQLKDAVDKL